MGWGLGLKVLFVGLLVAALVGLYFRYEHFVEENQRLRDETVSLRAGMASQVRANDMLKGENAALDKITTQQAQAQADSAKAIAGMRKDLNGLKASNEEVRKWTALPMPVDIYNRLLDDGTDNSADGDKAQSTGGSVGKVPGTADRGADKRGPVPVRQGPKGSPKAVQPAP